MNKKIRTIFLSFLLLFVFIFTSACSSGSSGTCDFWGYPTDDSSKMKIITLSKNAFYINIGETENIIVYVDGEDKTEEVTFSLVSENTKKTNVATVEKGLITPLKVGTAIFKVSYEGAEDVNFTVTAIDPILPNLEVLKTEINVELGNPTRRPENIIVMLNGEDVTEQATFTSTDEDIVTVDEKGNITFVGEGTANIIVHVEGANDQVITVNVTLSEITVTEEKIVLKVRDTYNLLPKINNIDVLENATFSSSDETVATVDENGLITAVGQGSTTIIISVNGAKSKEIKVYVDLANIENVEEEIALKVRDKHNLIPKIKDVEVIDKSDFTSSDETVATVDENGLITAVGQGSTIIKISVNGAIPKEITVNVDLADLILSQNELTLGLIDTLNIKENVVASIKENYVTDEVSFASNDEDILTVENGVITTGKKAGTATITVSLAGANSATINVTVNDDSIDVTLNNDLLDQLYAIGLIEYNSLNKTSFTEINIPDYYRCNDNCYKISCIESSLFSNCSSLTSVTIGDSVTCIGYNAFNQCTSLTSVTVPDSVLCIFPSAFYNCRNLTKLTTKSGTEINIPNSGVSTKDNVTFIGSKLQQYSSSYSSATSSIRSVTIPKGVTRLPINALYGCTALTSVTIPNTVTSIGNQAFAYCETLTSIDIPNSVISIEADAFLMCRNLLSIEIPDSVTSLGTMAFYHCYALKSVVLGDGIKSINYYTLGLCFALESVTITDGTICVFPSAFERSDKLTKLTTKSGKEISIPSSGYETIENVTFIDVRKMGSYAGSIRNIIIPEGVTEMGAFQLYYYLESIEIPDSITNILSSAFNYCRSLVSIEIPNSVISIGDYAFANATSLTSIEIPDSVTSLGNYAFYNCTNLNSVILSNNIIKIRDYTFSNCTSLNSINIPDGVIFIGQKAFYNCNNLTLTIPDSVKIIGSEALTGVNFYYNDTSASGFPWGGNYLGPIPE